ncbi:hypothetical protein OIE69_44375 (plasmid) [Actinacidiphila glaucinigra]|uniref:hypothetical protein n=1 Tax=Actinacidiphila glaucinigra TaxID=235986 RepID=UPI002DDAA6BE|nr:hypothetical protein [Actinacidiphila glaucinigra]WSD65942.1 hypothetical protein OIE69_44375 [Actinacidiphila glaucinigra]
MDTAELTAVAAASLASRIPNAQQVATITTSAVRTAGWMHYNDRETTVRYTDGTTGTVDLSDTPYHEALERHADDEANYGDLPDVTLRLNPDPVSPADALLAGGVSGDPDRAADDDGGSR